MRIIAMIFVGFILMAMGFAAILIVVKMDEHGGRRTFFSILFIVIGCIFMLLGIGVMRSVPNVHGEFAAYCGSIR